MVTIVFRSMHVFEFLSPLATSLPVIDSNLQQVTNGNAKFATKFYNVIAKEKGNIVFSPLCAHMTLTMSYQGGSGETAKQLASILNVPNQKQSASGYNSLVNMLYSLEDASFCSANNIFVMKNFLLKSQFNKAITEKFKSKTKLLNFSASQESADYINQWVEDKTSSRIKSFITPDCLDNLTRLVLINVIYFKTNWVHPFMADNTKMGSFHISKYHKIDCQMMHITEYFKYRKDKSLNAKILELPCNNNISMVIILPKSKDGIASLESKLINVDVSILTQHMNHVEVNVSIPKFEIETVLNLKPTLEKIGLKVIFKADKADFSEISVNPERLHVSVATQKILLEVTDEGTKAAPATSDILRSTCNRLPKQFEANHPFIIVLQVNKDNINTPLLMGRLSNPTT